MGNKNTTPDYNIESFKLNYRACIPLYVLLDKRLSGNEKVLYGLIEQMESSMEDVFINDRSLCHILGVSFESRILGKMQKKLKDFGYIKREEREVTLKDKTFYAYCWNTIKQSMTIEGSVPEVPMVAKNKSPPVPEVPTTSVPEVPTPPVPEVPTYNTHDLNPHDNRERGASLSQNSSTAKVNPLQHPKCIEDFNAKFGAYELTIEDLFEDYTAKTTHGISPKGFMVWIANERLNEHRRKKVAGEDGFFRAGDGKRTQSQEKAGKINTNALLAKLYEQNNKKVTIVDLVEQPQERKRVFYQKIEPKSFMTIQLPEQETC